MGQASLTHVLHLVRLQCLHVADILYRMMPHLDEETYMFTPKIRSRKVLPLLQDLVYALTGGLGRAVQVQTLLIRVLISPLMDLTLAIQWKIFRKTLWSL